jgi:hypothetical protein
MNEWTLSTSGISAAVDWGARLTEEIEREPDLLVLIRSQLESGGYVRIGLPMDSKSRPPLWARAAAVILAVRMAVSR